MVRPVFVVAVVLLILLVSGGVHLIYADKRYSDISTSSLNSHTSSNSDHTNFLPSSSTSTTLGPSQTNPQSGPKLQPSEQTDIPLCEGQAQDCVPNKPEIAVSALFGCSTGEIQYKSGNCVNGRPSDSQSEQTPQITAACLNGTIISLGLGQPCRLLPTPRSSSMSVLSPAHITAPN